MSIILESLEFYGRPLSFETGKVARQADGSVWVRYGDAVMLVTAVSNNEPRPDQDFFPLTCEYTEKTYAAGRIPGGYFKREGRPTEVEVLASRMIDRPLRPLFADGYMNETQIIATMVSFDPAVDPAPLAICGASAALHLSDIPFEGPVAAVRIGRNNGEFIVNPSFKQLEESDVNLLVACSRKGIVMVEGGARFVPEEQIVEALMLAQEAVVPLLDLQDRMRAAKGVTPRAFTPKRFDAELGKKLEKAVEKGYKAAQRIAVKLDRYAAYDAATKQGLIDAGVPDDQKKLAKAFLDDLKRGYIRSAMRAEKKRIDGRDFVTVRPIWGETGVLPRVHGSALFTRGETQVLASVTLGTASDEQRIEALVGDVAKRVLLHYNFPPYSVGEVRRTGSPSRRDIGHGNLALTGLTPSLPPQDEFPYTIRIVSEVLESNGSSSMATVCGSSMALMSAGVPVTTPVAGVAMGLIREEGELLVLTDILGDEDHYGDMDFKVVGNAQGVSGIQMDIKIDSIDKAVLLKALAQARDGRLHILGRMAEVISTPSAEMSPFAPKIVTMKIPEDRIRYLIGPGGKYIRGIQDQTGAIVNVEDDGTVQIAALGKESMDAAIALVKAVTGEVEEGGVYKGRVTKITDFGAFVQLMPGTEGLLHVSEMDYKRVEHASDICSEGDEIEVKVLAIDRASNRIRLSRRALLTPPEPGSPEEAEMKAAQERARDERPRRDDRGPRRDDRGPRRDDRGPRRDDRGPRNDNRGPRNDNRGPRQDGPAPTEGGTVGREAWDRPEPGNAREPGNDDQK